MKKWTAERIPSQAGRVAVVTGANKGIGFETAAALADRGATVVLAVRDVAKGRAAADRITERSPYSAVEVVELNLASLDSVRAAADEIASGHPRLDLLINNAGVMLTSKITTADGHELQFGTNHLAHFALTGLLMKQLLTTAGARVVTVSSLGHRVRARINFDDLNGDLHYDRMVAYGQSKLANLLFTYELQRRINVAGLATLAVAAHPGNSRTDLFGNAPTWIRMGARILAPLASQNPQMGALPTLRAATDPNVRGGQYFGPGGVGEQRGYPKLVQSSPQSHDEGLQLRLWQVSEALTGVSFSF